MPGLVPGISRFARERDLNERVIASAAKQSIHPLCRAMDCFAALAMTTRVPCASISEFDSQRSRFPQHTRKNFFIIFVDGIFTTFIECPFTNTSHAIRENPAMSCV